MVPTLYRGRLAAALAALAMAMPSISTAGDRTPPVNRYLLLQDAELGTEAAEELRRQVPFLADEVEQRPCLPAPVDGRALAAATRSPVGILAQASTFALASYSVACNATTFAATRGSIASADVEDSIIVGRPRIAGSSYGIAAPSGAYREEIVGDRLTVSIPDNWRRLVTGTAVTFAPDGASQPLRGALSFTHGVQVGVARSLTGDPQRDLEALLQTFGRGNPQVRWTPAFQRTQVARRPALTTSFTSVSALTGEFEQAWVAGTHLPGGALLYVVGVAPRDQSAVYGGVFRRIVESIRDDR